MSPFFSLQEEIAEYTLVMKYKASLKLRKSGLIANIIQISPDLYGSSSISSVSLMYIGAVVSVTHSTLLYEDIPLVASRTSPTLSFIVLFLIENYRNSFKFQNDFRADRHVRICNTIMRVRRDDYLFTLTASC